jgi:hypothetical protein
VYCYHTDTDTFATPLLYTNVNNKPYQKKSQNENQIDVSVWPPSWPVGWRNNTFSLNGSITTGEYLWFGFHSGYFTTRFDYGGDCYKGWFDYDLYEEYDGEPTPYINIGQWDSYCTIKWSWYFIYTAVTSQNYVRTLTQGVSLSDSQRKNTGYKRITTQTVNANATASKMFLRFCKVFDEVGITDTISHLKNFIRGIVDITRIESEAKGGHLQFRKISDTVQVMGLVFRGLLLFIRIVTGAFVRDYLLSRFLKAREELVLKSAICREVELESKI